MKDEIIDRIVAVSGLSVHDVSNMIEVPPSSEMGDYAFPCFSLVEKYGGSPSTASGALIEDFMKNSPKEITTANSSGPYANFFGDKKIFVEKVLKKVKKKDFGKLDFGKGKSRVVEYSQPNTHKAFHVGHIRGTSLGESLARIFRACGETIVQMNYSGDTGMHIAKWIWCYQNFHSDEELKEDEAWIAGIYVDAGKRLKENESLQEEVDEINRKIENGEDEELNELWKKTREMSIKSWDRIYEELSAHFDYSFFESEFEEAGRKESLDLLKRSIAKKDDAVFMDLKEFNLGVWVLLRKDGTVLYSAKDIALARKKFEEFNNDKYLITIGNEQEMHFRQLVKTLELMGLEEEAKRYDVLTFGMVRFPEGKMSSRSGANVLYSDFIREVVDVAKRGLKQRGCIESELDERALKIAIASVKYSMLKQNPKKTMIFDPRADVAFEGDTGPYLLYSYARAASLLRKAKKKDSGRKIADELEGSEVKLVKKIDLFEDVLKNAYEGLAPNLIANYCFELAQDFNEFYHACPVLGEKSEGFRLAVVEAFRVVMEKGLDLLGIEKLEEM